MGCEAVIDRRAEGYKFWNDDDTPSRTVATARMTGERFHMTPIDIDREHHVVELDAQGR